MNSPSIYDDLPNTDLGEKVTKLKEHNENLLKHIKTLEDDIQKLCGELMKMKKTEDNLKRNISELFNTSKVEIERKDRMIAELRKRLDDLLFRRRNAYSSSTRNGEHLGRSNINKRSRDEAVPEHHSENKKQKIESAKDTNVEDAKIQFKIEEVTIKSEPSRSYSNSPSRHPRSRSRDNHKSSERNKIGRSKERSKHHSREKYPAGARSRKRSRSRIRHGRERDRNHVKSKERNRSYSRSRESNHGRNKSERVDKHSGKDLRELLRNRQKPTEKTIFKKCDVNHKDFNRTIKDELDRNLNQYNEPMKCKQSSNSKTISDAKDIKIEESSYTGEENENKSDIDFGIAYKDTKNETKVASTTIKNEFQCSNGYNNVEEILNSEMLSGENHMQIKTDPDISCEVNIGLVTLFEKSEVNQKPNKTDENTECTNITAAVESNGTISNGLVHHENSRFSESKQKIIKSSAVEKTLNKPTNGASSEEQLRDNKPSDLKQDVEKQDQTNNEVSNMNPKESVRSRRRCIIKILN